jgi:hypothetical protein
VESLNAVKRLALALGFVAAFFFETNQAVSVEIWDPKQLTWLASEDNPDFDRLNE